MGKSVGRMCSAGPFAIVASRCSCSHASRLIGQALIAWQWALGIPTNPRTFSVAHMAENIKAVSGSIKLTPAEISSLSGAPQVGSNMAWIIRYASWVKASARSHSLAVQLNASA